LGAKRDSSQELYVISNDQFLTQPACRIRITLVIPGEELNINARRQLAPVLRHVKPDAPLHALADIRTDSGKRQEQADADRFRVGHAAKREAQQPRHKAAQPPT
jgi:hypothetical protein